MHIILASTILYNCASWRVDMMTKYYESRQIKHGNGYILSHATERQKYTCEFGQLSSQHVSIARAIKDTINLCYLQFFCQQTNFDRLFARRSLMLQLQVLKPNFAEP